MGALTNSIFYTLYDGIEPFFDFMSMLWSSFPLPFRFTFVLLFGVAITFAIIKNIIL